MNGQMNTNAFKDTSEYIISMVVSAIKGKEPGAVRVYLRGL